jgi:glycosyltransferase involved in cell wall biosynthesis
MTAFKISKIHPKILFQYHPQSGCVKEILQDEIDKNPAAKKTILEETEFRYSKKQLDDSVREVELSDFAVGASTFTLKTLIKQGMAENCVHMAPYGVNIKDFKPRRDFRKIDKMRFLFVGSFSQRKGISYLLQAFKELENEGENISLTMAGRGIMDYDLVKSYELKCLETHVNLPLEKLVELMQESDVFVFPSICEGFGLVLIQAMATGMPLITTYNTSGPDFIEEGKDGFLIEAQDVEAIKNKVRYFLQNPDEVKRMGQNAILKSKDFTWERFSAEIIKSVDEAEKIFVK